MGVWTQSLRMVKNIMNYNSRGFSVNSPDGAAALAAVRQKEKAIVLSENGQYHYVFDFEGNRHLERDFSHAQMDILRQLTDHDISCTFMAYPDIPADVMEALARPYIRYHEQDKADDAALAYWKMARCGIMSADVISLFAELHHNGYSICDEIDLSQLSEMHWRGVAQYMWTYAVPVSQYKNVFTRITTDPMFLHYGKLDPTLSIVMHMNEEFNFPRKRR